MSIRQLPRVNTVDNLADAEGKKVPILKIAGLFPVEINGTIDFREEGKFLLNPSTWNESKSVNWVEQNVPGQSDPPLQWVSSGARVVTFQALVTADTSDFVAGQTAQPGQSSAKNLTDKFTSAFAGIASAFAKVSIPPKRTGSVPNLDLDITLYLNYYRSLLYPTYDDVKNPRRLKSSPPLLVLFSGKSLTKFPYGVGGTKITSQHDLWVITNLNIQITKQLPNLAPMEALVDFQLMQYNVRSFSRDRFLLPDE